MSTRLAVLCSGGGSNLQALLDYFAALTEPRGADIVLVASDRASAGALERARAHGIPWIAMDAVARTTGMLALIRSHGVDCVALAGYLRFIPNEVTDALAGRILNIHPALLPAFGGPGMYGRRVHEAALRAGVRVSGATAHFVDAAYDHGPIIAQWPVPVFPDDTTEGLAQRVLEVEHVMYPRVVYAVAAGTVTLGADGRVHGPSSPNLLPHFTLSPEPDAARIALSLVGDRG
ncbi:MAG: phosphoribosylglycinamide formyltransferase [Gemmatimonadaceae bacterium]